MLTKKKDALIKRYREVRDRIEMAVSPFITVRIRKPPGVDLNEFLELERDEEFIKALEDFAAKWISKRKSEKLVSPQS